MINDTDKEDIRAIVAKNPNMPNDEVFKELAKLKRERLERVSKDPWVKNKMPSFYGSTSEGQARTADRLGNSKVLDDAAKLYFDINNKETSLRIPQVNKGYLDLKTLPTYIKFRNSWAGANEALEDKHLIKEWEGKRDVELNPLKKKEIGTVNYHASAKGALHDDDELG